MYEALYRKYRPKTFDDVVGQPFITETLKTQVRTGRLSHAYLFIGTRGTGKTTCARILAKAVNCEHPVDGNPCNECDACRGIEDGSVLDVVELDAASNNGVDDVRMLRDEAIFSPTTVRKRVYIIDEVHMLSKPAFNALLKILEEPPDYGVFLILSTNAERLLPTIRSRCAELQLGPVAQDEALPFLRQNAPDKPDGVLRAAYLRAQRRRKLAQTLEKRRDDEVQYAFIVNPSKPQAEARRLHIQRFCEAKGLNRIRFYDTQLDKDGRVCALEALEDGADVVIAVGGDGTVRTVASAVSGTGHALGIIPIGTGNLFARNMGVPVDDIDAALTVATSHGSRLVDMGRLTLLDHPEDDHGHAFLIIAGIGFDAAMIDDTNPELKANISWLACFVGGVKNLFAPKFRGTLTVTSADGSTHTIKNLDFRTVMAGNCGQIPMFSLMPAASYDDGLLDFEIIDTTGGILGWANLFGDVVHQTIIGKPEQNPLSTNSTIEQVQGVSAEITLEKPAKAQVDGDMLPETKHIRFSVDHRALIVRVPDASALEKTAQAAASNATSDFAEMTGTLEPIR